VSRQASQRLRIGAVLSVAPRPLRDRCALRWHISRRRRVAQAFDFAGATNPVGAPSFAQFEHHSAKGGSGENDPFAGRQVAGTGLREQWLRGAGLVLENSTIPAGRPQRSRCPPAALTLCAVMCETIVDASCELATRGDFAASEEAFRRPRTSPPTDGRKTA